MFIGFSSLQVFFSQSPPSSLMESLPKDLCLSQNCVALSIKTQNLRPRSKLDNGSRSLNGAGIAAVAILSLIILISILFLVISILRRMKRRKGPMISLQSTKEKEFDEESFISECEEQKATTVTITVPALKIITTASHTMPRRESISITNRDTWRRSNPYKSLQSTPVSGTRTSVEIQERETLIQPESEKLKCENDECQSPHEQHNDQEPHNQPEPELEMGQSPCSSPLVFAEPSILQPLRTSYYSYSLPPAAPSTCPTKPQKPYRYSAPSTPSPITSILLNRPRPARLSLLPSYGYRSTTTTKNISKQHRHSPAIPSPLCSALLPSDDAARSLSPKSAECMLMANPATHGRRLSDLSPGLDPEYPYPMCPAQVGDGRKLDGYLGKRDDAEHVTDEKRKGIVRGHGRSLSWGR